MAATGAPDGLDILESVLAPTTVELTMTPSSFLRDLISYVRHLERETSECRAKNDALRAALDPFAQVGEAVDSRTHGPAVIEARFARAVAPLTIGQFRAAAAALVKATAA